MRAARTAPPSSRHNQQDPRALAQMGQHCKKLALSKQLQHLRSHLRTVVPEADVERDAIVAKLAQVDLSYNGYTEHVRRDEVIAGCDAVRDVADCLDQCEQTTELCEQMRSETERCEQFPDVPVDHDAATRDAAVAAMGSAEAVPLLESVVIGSGENEILGWPVAPRK